MGLLKKRKAAVEKILGKNIHEITCLYCFKVFTHDKVLFRSHEFNDDEGCVACPDIRLDAYRALFGNPSAGELPEILDPETYREVEKHYHKGVLASLHDEYGGVSTRRICPYCHNDIVKNAGYSPCTIIAVAGPSHAETSVCFTSLIQTLKTVTSRNFQIFCMPLNNAVSRRFKREYEDPLNEYGRFPGPEHNEGKRELLVFTVSFAGDEMPELHVVYMNPAVKNEDNEYGEIYSALMRNASGLIFYVDPAQINDLRKKINPDAETENPADPFEEPADTLARLKEDLFFRGTGSRSATPAAITLTKTDLLGDSLENENGDDGPNYAYPFVHKKYFNLLEYGLINRETKNIFENADPNFYNGIKNIFNDYGFCAVSALGAIPELICQRAVPVSPVRMDEPLLWLMYVLGFIEGRKP